MSAAQQTVNNVAAEALAPTPLATALAAPSSGLVAYLGALTPNLFSSLNQELVGLITDAAFYDLGYKALLYITGTDRVRWLNGMVSNTVQGLPENHWNYSLLLNAKGRIQGDANVYRTPETLILQTDRSQIARLSAHLDHFIIMDDVELQPLDATQTALGVAGPKAADILKSLSLPLPEEGAFATATLGGTGITIVHAHSPVVPKYELWIPVAVLTEVLTSLQNAGAVPVGVAAVEGLRILEATPIYGLDVQDRHLAQETAQTRALNFNKGCYLGQEIVERIRSRATVHRTLQQFSVENAPESLETGKTIEINAEGMERNPAGELTSLANYNLSAFTGTLALGFIRNEVVERGLPLSHSGGTATVLETPPISKQ